MKNKDFENIYSLFNLFESEFILKTNSILTDDKGILTVSAIDNCIKNYVENYDDGEGGFGEKVKGQFKDADYQTRLVFAHAEWLWAFAVDDILIKTKKRIVRRTLDIPDDDKLKDVFVDGFGSAGMYHKNNKYWEVSFNLHLLKFLRSKIEKKEISDTKSINNWIEKICLFKKYEIETKEYPLPDEFKKNLPDRTIAMCNVLLYLSFPEKYERIASDNHKEKIISTFEGLLSEKEQNNEEINSDEKVFMIRTKLGEITKNPDFDFYEKKYQRAWNYSKTQNSFDEIQALQYKKAIILYGPPGTSKTFTARTLAENLITKEYLRNKENILKYFKGEVDIINRNIHSLQLHQNYSYEDFIAGVQLRNNATEVVKGKLFEIIEAVLNEKNKYPHILILDEINRVDLSKLFGEVFSAMENREKAIELCIGGQVNLELTIPDNLYLIGTMNEIDFSLERIDFALRRRFLWFFYGFDSDKLLQIINIKNLELETKIKDEEIEQFIINAESLNKAICKIPELGEQYQIGHTFFAEIVNIYKTYKDIKGKKRMNKQFYRDNGPAQILWDISLKPMLNAFLGNMETESRNEKINELYKIYYP